MAKGKATRKTKKLRCQTGLRVCCNGEAVRRMKGPRKDDPIGGVCIGCWAYLRRRGVKMKPVDDEEPTRGPAKKLVEWNGDRSVCGRFMRQRERGLHDRRAFYSLMWSKDGKPPYKGDSIRDRIPGAPGGDGTIRGVKREAEWLARRWADETDERK